MVTLILLGIITSSYGAKYLKNWVGHHYLWFLQATLQCWQKSLQQPYIAKEKTNHQGPAASSRTTKTTSTTAQPIPSTATLNQARCIALWEEPDSWDIRKGTTSKCDQGRRSVKLPKVLETITHPVGVIFWKATLTAQKRARVWLSTSPSTLRPEYKSMSPCISMVNVTAKSDPRQDTNGRNQARADAYI